MASLNNSQTMIAGGKTPTGPWRSSRGLLETLMGNPLYRFVVICATLIYSFIHVTITLQPP